MSDARAAQLRDSVDHSAWDGGAAMSGCASSGNPAAAYKAICAGKKSGDPAKQSSWALPHHKHPGDAPNASGVANALARLPQTQGLTNAAAAKSHLQAHMKTINPDYQAGAAMTPAQARAARAAACGGNRRALSGPTTRLEPFRAQWRSAAPQMRDGVMLTKLDGYATVYGIEYEMYDAFGPYKESVSPDAAGLTLASAPDVAFLENHRGLTMARTKARDGRQPTLLLDSDPRGLHAEAWVNQERTDVRDLVIGIDDGIVTEMSFGFWITEGSWDDDYEHFCIEAFDLDRGDVSAVNYGANPYTEIAARSRTILAELDHLPAGAQRAALSRLRHALGPIRQMGDMGMDGTGDDEDVNALIASLDATLDQAIALIGGVDTAGLPDAVAQAIALLTAAETVADELMEACGITDPGEPAELAAAGAPQQRGAAPVADRLGALTRATTGKSVEYYQALLRL